ncbi:MAG: hypothetical protein AMXMBFR53_25730 [Gemmatimonadota bacterium]
MQRQLYPTEFIDSSIEQHLGRHSTRSQAIYITILLALCGTAASLPMIRVDVSVQAEGIVRPVIEKHEVKAPTSGYAETVAVREAQEVQEGQLLLSLRDAPLQERLAVGRAQLGQARSLVRDLELLTSTESPLALSRELLETAKYRQELVRFLYEFEEGRLNEERAAQALARSQTMYERQLLSRVDLEDREYELARIRATQGLLVEEYQNAWQAELTSLRRELDQAQIRQGQMVDEKALYSMEAPVTGTLERVTPISPGSYVRTGDVIAVISPESDLVAEVFVPPRSIGFLRLGTDVRMQIDAFNYRDWGFVTGEVSQIADDFVLIDQRPMFRVRVTMDDTRLQLNNGYTSTLKKGMTLRARFLVTKRSLYQLLRDDVNDWLNPLQAQQSDR